MGERQLIAAPSRPRKTTAVQPESHSMECPTCRRNSRTKSGVAMSYSLAHSVQMNGTKKILTMIAKANNVA